MSAVKGSIKYLNMNKKSYQTDTGNETSEE